ncbi:hypothetical protein Vretimale_12919 [Volvox reticuliferus]|nr:hypothetical protein Vretimale_12919 [Volvox reticuliferus]
MFLLPLAMSRLATRFSPSSWVLGSHECVNGVHLVRSVGGITNTCREGSRAAGVAAIHQLTDLAGQFRSIQVRLASVNCECSLLCTTRPRRMGRTATIPRRRPQQPERLFGVRAGGAATTASVVQATLTPSTAGVNVPCASASASFVPSAVGSPSGGSTSMASATAAMTTASGALPSPLPPASASGLSDALPSAVVIGRAAG